jgi:hypothetical protein
VEGDKLVCIGAVRWDGGDDDVPNVPDIWREPQLADVRVSVVVEQLSGGVVDAAVCRANGNVPERGRVYNRRRGEVVQMDTDAKAVEELLACSGRAGGVRGFCF